jgi:hypothetical protein
VLDKPEKTQALLATLQAAVPFEIRLTPELIVELARQQTPIIVEPTETVSDVSYAGDEGGIMCHIRPTGGGNMVVVALTHLRAPRFLSFAAAVSDYQKHRLKKFRKRDVSR